MYRKISFRCPLSRFRERKIHRCHKKEMKSRRRLLLFAIKRYLRSSSYDVFSPHNFFDRCSDWSRVCRKMTWSYCYTFCSVTHVISSQAIHRLPPPTAAAQCLIWQPSFFGAGKSLSCCNCLSLGLVISQISLMYCHSSNTLAAAKSRLLLLNLFCRLPNN
jgi:hypothetical protein